MLTNDATSQLMAAVRNANIKVLGYDLVKNDAEARLLTSIIRAYGDSPVGFIYASPSRASTTLRPPDVVLCHPDVGLLVIEAKGHVIDQIEGIEAGSIFVRYEGHTRPDNVIRQVEDQMYSILHDIQRKVRDRRAEPFVNCMVAFPNISQSEWQGRGYDKAHPNSQFLFREQVEEKNRLTRRISGLVRDELHRAKRSSPLEIGHIDVILEVFGNSDVINEKRPPRLSIDTSKLGSYVDDMMALEKYLSAEQKELSALPTGRYPRLIRGVAGSGKSVVLANMVARYLHRKLENLDQPLLPAERVSIAVTCFNHALVDFLRRKIRLAYREQTLDENIPAEVLLISHFNQLVWLLIKERGWPISYIRVQDVPSSTERATLYTEMIEKFANEHPEWYQSSCFDVIFVDEGQDFEPAEYQLLSKLIRPHPNGGERPLVVFYDDAQNLYGRARPIWSDIGINVSIGDRSKVMQECFRNTRQIVELAFNVLLGSQAPSEVRVRMRTYADVAYLKNRNLIEEVGDHFRVGFAEREYSVPIVKEFYNKLEEIEWVSQDIARLIKDENVRPEDILIIFYRPNGFDWERLTDAIRNKIGSINFMLPFGDSSDKDHYIFKKDYLTLSTVYGVKGYDAPIVYIVGTDRFDYDNLGRAAFYVAATRAKLLLTITGVSSGMSLLLEARSVSRVL